MRFTKMHGAGNDYVYVDLFDEAVADAPSVARAVSDRNRGVGGDGLILMAPARGDGDVRMEVYNADGSRAQMCGNGIRCLAVLARRHGRAAANAVRVETDAGLKIVELCDDGARVDMGTPSMGELQELDVLGTRFDVTYVSMGNPHVVIFVDDVDSTDVERYGRAIETHERFPEGTNVAFVQVIDRGHVRQRTWERGSGETLACGTGACAVCVAGVRTGRIDSPLRDTLRGGELLLEWDGEGSVFMTGPAVLVFTGEWNGDGV